MTHLSHYASYLLSNRLNDFTTANIQLLREHNVAILHLLQDLNEQELYAYVRQSLEAFLTNFVANKGLEAAMTMLQKWEANEIPSIPKDKVTMEDITMVYSIRKQTLIELLSSFTSDINTNNAIVLELEAFFREVQKQALKIYFQIQNQILIDKNIALQQAEQKQIIINQALKESQAMAHLGHWELDFFHDNKLYWSDELYKVYGVEPNKKLNLDFVLTFVQGQYVPTLQEKIQNAITHGVPFVYEYKICRGDGKTRDILSKAYPERNENGEIIKLKGICQDITERKEIEEALKIQREELQAANEELSSQQEELQTINEELRESQEALQAINEELKEQIEQRVAIEEALREREEKFRLLATNSSDMISTHTPEGVFTYVSPSCKTLLGYSENELIGQQVYDYFHLEDIALIQQKHAQGLKLPDTQVLTYRIRNKAGEYIWFESTAHAIRDAHTDAVIELQVSSRDITLRKKVEEALEKEREYLKAILEHITDGIVACDEHGVLSFFNQASRKFHGLSEKSVLPDQWAEHYSLYYIDGKTLMKKEDIPLFKAYRGEVVENIEMVIAPTHGKKRRVLSNGRRIISPEGRILGAVVVMHDITQQKEVEQELLALNHQLKTSNEELVRTEQLLKELNDELEEKVAQRSLELQASAGQFKFLTDAIPQIIWAADASGNVNYFNKHWYDYTGLDEENSNNWGWKDVLHPDDVERSIPQWMQALQIGEAFESEHRFKRALDGSYRWHLARGVAMKDEKGTVVKWLGFCTDIHDRKLAAEELGEKNKTLAVINSVGVTLSAQLDLNQIVQIVTDASTELTGAQFGAFFYNMRNEKNESLTLYTISGVPREKFSNFPMPRNTAIFSPTFKGEGIIRSDDITKDPRYGKNAPYHGMPEGHLPVKSYLAVPVISRSGEVLGGLYFGHSQAGVFKSKAEDIILGIASQAAIAIDNARLFEALKVKNKELVTINADLDNFMYTASHDLKAPIVNLESIFAILNKKMIGKINEPEQKLFDMAQYSIQKFNRTIRDLTEITSIDKNKEENMQVSFKEVLEDVKSDIGQIISESDCLIETNFKVEFIPIERKNLRSIIYNLLSNAIKYRSTERALEINITTFEEGNFVVFKISDNGLGISATQQARLFMIFNRFHSHVEGSGIGLYIIKRIVENKGGHIEVTSEEGKGTTFSIFFRK